MFLVLAVKCLLQSQTLIVFNAFYKETNHQAVNTGFFKVHNVIHHRYFRQAYIAVLCIHSSIY